MAQPNSRASLIEYCLRSLGKPVINIEIDENQLSDRIDEAIEYYQMFHYDATQHTLLLFNITQDNLNNHYLVLDDSIIGIVQVFPPVNNLSSLNMFDFRYQLRQNELWQLSSISYVPYVMTMTHIQMLNILFNGEPLVRYSRHTNKLYIDTDWGVSVKDNDYIMVEAIKILDPDVYTSIYSDPYLKNLCAAMIKRQWGDNMKKYGGLQLPGGVILNGQIIYDEALKEIKELKDECRSTWEKPIPFLVA